jgi:ribosomal protein L13
MHVNPLAFGKPLIMPFGCFQVVGRAATVISRALQGKDRPDYCPQHDMGDVVVVINADKAIFTGKKYEEKKYYSHSGRPGNLKITTPKELTERVGSEVVICKAVNGMLPKNRLRDVRRFTLMTHYNFLSRTACAFITCSMRFPSNTLRCMVHWHWPPRAARLLLQTGAPPTHAKMSRLKEPGPLLPGSHIPHLNSQSSA